MCPSPNVRHLDGFDLRMSFHDEALEICCEAGTRLHLRSAEAWESDGQLENVRVLHLLNDSYLIGADPSMSLCHEPLETCFDSS